MLLAKLIYCQQDSYLFHFTGNCPEYSMESDSFLTEHDILENLFEIGYPYATIDSMEVQTNRKTYYLDCGPRFSFVSIRMRDSQALLLQKLEPKIVPWSQVIQQRRRMLTQMADKGFPYTRLLTKVSNIYHDTLEMTYNLDTIRRIYVNKIEIEGKFSMNSTLFKTMTGISEGQSFNFEKIENSRQIIQHWEFATLQNLEYDFNPYSVNLKYFIEPRQPSRFDLLIGLVPSSRMDQKYEITGNGYLDIHNQLKMAERIYLKFDKYANSSQSFDLRFDFPYLPVLHSGILAEGLIDRRDSTVLDVDGRIGVQYSWRPGMKYAFFLKRTQSRIISVNSRRLKNEAVLPAELDYNYSAGGFQFARNSVDNSVNPRNGYLIQIALAGGVRKVVRNGQILAIELPENQTSFLAQYDSLEQSTFKSDLDVSWDQYFSVGQYSTLRLRGLGGWTWSNTALYDNEYRRIGGFRDFRGFPEKSFHTDAYGMMTVEYRFLFGVESNAYVFSDFGILHQKGSTSNWNIPYSVGVGLNLGTKAGIFGISYAVGGQRNQPFSLEQSRVNFGLMVNY